MLFQLCGWEVATAQDGAEALSWLAENRADVVITDYTMPQVDGCEMLRIMKRDARLTAVPVLVYSGETDLPAELRALGTEVLPKSAEIATLCRITDELVK